MGEGDLIYSIFDTLILHVQQIVLYIVSFFAVIDNLQASRTKSCLPQSILNILILEHVLTNIRGSITSIRRIYVIAVKLMKDNPGGEYDSCKHLFSRELD